MRKSRSSGSVGERGGNDPLYPENKNEIMKFGNQNINKSDIRHPTSDIQNKSETQEPQ